MFRREVRLRVECDICERDENEDEFEQDGFWDSDEIKLILVSIPVFLTGLYIEIFTSQKVISQILFLVVVAISGRGVISNGLKNLLKGRITINFLILIAAGGAFLIGHGEEGAAVIFLFAVAEYLEEYAERRSRYSIRELLKTRPTTATVLRDGKEVKIHAHDVKVGDIVVVRPGEKIPADGVIVRGESHIDMSHLTGESIPVRKSAGEEVFAGALNREGFLEIKVTKGYEDSLIMKVTKLVEKARMRKSHTEKFIERFAKYYTPAVIILAVFTAIVPVLVFGLSFDVWVYRALVLLVVACPCALAISTPVSMVSGITSGARNGVLIKGSDVIENLQRVRVVAIDKTGTLTEGRLEVSEIRSYNGFDPNRILEITASLESRSEHPLAKAILDEAEKRGLKLRQVEKFVSFPGKGVGGIIDGVEYHAGRREMFDEVPDEDTGQDTAVYVGRDGEVIGVIVVRDRVRRESETTVSALKSMGLEVVMLTGDNENVANSVAEKTGIDMVYSGLFPQDKAGIVDELRRNYGSVAMVGDGVNDAVALAEADVGIAMGAMGSDVAIETADVSLLNDELTKIPYLFRLAGKTMNVVRMNVTASVIVKASFAVMAIAGMISLWVAVAVGDMGLSLAVILNAMRISRIN